MAITTKYIIVCDDFRREDNGKFILIGMYLPDIVVPQIPFVVPALTFFCNLESDRPGNFRFSMRLRHEDTGRVLGEGMGMLPVNNPGLPIICPIKLGNVQFNAPGLYSFSLEIENQQPIVTTFNVQLGIPGAAPAGPLQGPLGR